MNVRGLCNQAVTPYPLPHTHSHLSWPQLMHTISGSGIGHLCLSPDKTGVLLAGTLDGSVCAFDFRLATSASGSSSNSSASSVGAGAQCVTAVVGYVPGPISSMAFTAGVDDLVVGTRSGDIFRQVFLSTPALCLDTRLLLVTQIPAALLPVALQRTLQLLRVD